MESSEEPVAAVFQLKETEKRIPSEAERAIQGVPDCSDSTMRHRSSGNNSCLCSVTYNEWFMYFL